MLNAVWPLVAWGFLSVAILFFLLWLAHLQMKNAGVVDVGWGPGFVILMTVFATLGAGWTTRNIVLWSLFALWGFRIAFFLLKRLKREGHEDRRYQRIRREWGGHIEGKFLAFFEFQAFLQVILALPFAFVALNPAPGLHSLEIIGCMIVLAALVGESVADEQLLAFKSDPANAGKTCDTGLWRYSRHPNYFFEWLIWVGFSVYSLPTPLGWISPISPLIMYVLMMYFSGIPLSEAQAIRSRGEEYLRYQRVTSPFFPLPRRVS